MIDNVDDKVMTINRTLVELKRKSKIQKGMVKQTINRTLVELKPVVSSSSQANVQPYQSYLSGIKTVLTL